MANDEMPPKPTCFVVMPITTPTSMLATYGDDNDHFGHVFEHLFKPALDAAGYDVIPPSAEGSEVIHADIVQHLERADLVLCDLSTLNANVFFELGIRTSLDRPVCMVKDSTLERMPFDTVMINCLTYDAGLRPWSLGRDIEALTRHLTATAVKAGGVNALWRFFGLTRRGEAATIDDPIEAKLDLILSTLNRGGSLLEGMSNTSDWAGRLERVLSEQYPEGRFERVRDDVLHAYMDSGTLFETFDRIESLADTFGVDLVLRLTTPPRLRGEQTAHDPAPDDAAPTTDRTQIGHKMS